MIEVSLPFTFFSLLTWEHPEATRKLFTALCVALLASLVLRGKILFMIVGKLLFGFSFTYLQFFFFFFSS